MAKYQLERLTEYLQSLREEHVVLAFEDIERIVQGPLPASARHHQVWWSNTGHPHARHWTDAGFRTSFRELPRGHVRFRRADEVPHGRTAERPRGVLPRDLTSASPVSSGSPAAVLIGCTKSKAAGPLKAKDLYMASALFRKRRAYAERSGLPWFIVSALHGLIEPDQIIAPYELSMKQVRGEKRKEWARGVVSALEDRLGSLSGKTIEVHAGEDYVNSVRQAFGEKKASAYYPLRGLRGIGKQQAWYGAQGEVGDHPKTAVSASAGSLPDAKRRSVLGSNEGIAARLSGAFYSRGLDLSTREGAPTPGWEGMPEVFACRALREAGASEQHVRLFLTFTAAMDRMRDADRLWRDYALGLWQREPWAFDARSASTCTFKDLKSLLRSSHVSQRHDQDSWAWRSIAWSLSQAGGLGPVASAVHKGEGDARELFADLQSLGPAGRPRFPLLRGPKIGAMWVRMLAHPGGATIENLSIVPVAVDVQVRKVTENLGLTGTSGLSIETARATIQEAWRRDVETGGAQAPGALKDTCAGLDPALWFFGKWGCTVCERAAGRRPIAEVCGLCGRADGRDR